MLRPFHAFISPKQCQNAKKNKNNLNIALFSLVKNASAVLARVKKYNPLSFMGFFLIANIVNFTTYTYSSKFFKYSMD